MVVLALLGLVLGGTKGRASLQHLALETWLGPIDSENIGLVVPALGTPIIALLG